MLRPPGSTHGGVPCAGAMDHWQALERWRSPDYFQSLAGMRTVPVEVGRHYLAEGWGQRLMPLSDFIEHHLQQPLGAHRAGERPAGLGFRSLYFKPYRPR